MHQPVELLGLQELVVDVHRVVHNQRPQRTRLSLTQYLKNRPGLAVNGGPLDVARVRTPPACPGAVQPGTT